MITKILLTLLVIVAASVFARHKATQKRQQTLKREAEEAENRKTAMFIATALVVLTLLLSGVLYYEHWKEQHKLFTVVIINSHTGDEQRHQVYQRDIDGRGFRTVDGRTIILSDAERMEVVETSSE